MPTDQEINEFLAKCCGLQKLRWQLVETVDNPFSYGSRTTYRNSAATMGSK